MNTIAPNGYAEAHRRSWEWIGPRANFFTRAQILEMCVKASLRVPGNIVEFGVADGSSTRAIKHALQRHGKSWLAPFGRKKIFALDSFEGLRESFENAPVGMFAGEVPKISGVKFVKGYFEQTCTDELRDQIGKVAFAHLDADLYSSTTVALSWLTPMLSSGSLLLFDEFTGGNFAEQRACDEWRTKYGIELIRVAEFDREPSGNGSTPDRRLIFQVVKDGSLPERTDQNRVMWKIAYYCGRVGMLDLRARIKNRMS